MGNRHSGCKIISKVILYRSVLNFNNFGNICYVKSRSLTHSYFRGIYIAIEMPPKRGRPAAKDTKQKVADVEDDVPAIEKKPATKRGRKPASKLPSDDEKTKIVVNNFENDVDDDGDGKIEVEMDEPKKITKKPIRGGAKKMEAAPATSDIEPKEVKKSGRKQRAPTKRKVQQEEEEEEEEEEESEPEPDSEPEPVPMEKPSSRKPKGAAKNKVEAHAETKPEDVPEPNLKGTKKTARNARANAKTTNETKSTNDDVKEPPSKKPKTETKMLNPTDTDLDSIDYDCDKLNSKGEKYNLKICSWNVSGIRALIKKNGMDYFPRENADIIAIQETKCDMKKLPDEIKIPGYKHYYLDSEKSGYCGVALYCKNDYVPLDIKYGINNSELDKEGRLITAEFNDFYLINAYVPNAGQKLVTMPKRLKWNDIFKAYVKKLEEEKPVIICGDMNVAHQEIDLTNPKTNTKNAGFTREERDGMTELLAAGFSDTFRQLYPDKTGAYTFWSYFANSRSKNIGWRLDYFIVSESIKGAICDNVIRSSVNGSDHCPIVLYAKL